MTTQPHGTWPSPIDSAALVSANATVADLVADGTDLFWLQERPSEGGRSAVMRRDLDGTISEVSPPGFNARTRVHEYGGGALAARAGVVLATSWADHRVHQIDVAAVAAAPVTAAPADPAGRRWAAMAINHTGHWFVAVRETHGADRAGSWPAGAPDEARNEIVAVDITTGEESVLVSGRDFVSGPWLSGDSSRLAWLEWDHPEMPWDAAELWVGDLSADGAVLTNRVHIAGGLTPDRKPRGSSVADAAWSPDGTLVFTHDPDGFWNVYRWSGGAVDQLLPEAQVDRGLPRWQHRSDQLAVLAEGQVAAIGVDAGLAHVEMVGRGRITGPEVTVVRGLQPYGRRIAMIHGGPAAPQSISLLDPDTGALELVHATADVSALAALAVAPVPLAFPTADGTEAHALYYAPHHPDHEGPAHERPPLVVMTHGGPTSAAVPVMSVGKLYWTSRGFAVVDVNYRGSTGYGRAYRDALRGQWGIADVEDVVAAVTHLAGEGLADPARVAIRGGSAGGYTTLMALCTTDTFAAGCSLFGVSDLAALARDTHKFESRYLDGLVGRWPEDEWVYADRSPVNRTGTLATPMLILQGDEDEVVPPSQAELMVAALAEKGITHAYLLFEGEQHGFRKADSITRAIEAELSFYGHVFKIATNPAVELPLRP